jgi:hypothetical protein
VDYGQNGVPREVNSQPSTTAQATPVQINISALDSQSILDRSDDIASAVRQAILNSNSLVDVIRDR